MNLECKPQSISWLIGNIGKDNLAAQFDENTLQMIGADVVGDNVDI